MRGKLAELVSVGAGVVFGVVGLAGPMRASAAPVDVVAEGWSWQTQRQGLPALGGASNVRDDQLPVAWIGQPDKVSYVRFGDGIASGSRMTLTFQVDQGGSNVQPEGVHIVACVVTADWQPGSPMSWDERPGVSCDPKAVGVYEPNANTFFFDLTDLLPRLLATGNKGIALQPADDSGATAFQVVFASAARGGVRVSYEPSSGSAVSPPAPPGTAAADTGASPVSSDTSSAPLFADTGSTAAASLPSAEQPVLPAKTSAGPRSASTQTSPALAARAGGRPASFSGVYAGMLGLAALLVLGRFAGDIEVSR